MDERPSAPSRVRFGTFEADLESGELRRNGIKIKLQEQPFQLLAMLLERPGEVVSREAVRERLWPVDTFVDFDHSLNTAVKKVGRARDSPKTRLYRDAGTPRLRFIAPVTSTVAAPFSSCQTLHREVPIHSGPAARRTAPARRARLVAPSLTGVLILTDRLGHAVCSSGRRRQAPERRARYTRVLPLRS